MSDSLGDLLAKRQYEEPPEIKQIKAYIQEHIGVQTSVSIRSDQYIVSVPNAAAAGALRMHSYTIEQLCDLKKRLIIRIGR